MPPKTASHYDRLRRLKSPELKLCLYLKVGDVVYSCRDVILMSANPMWNAYQTF